MGSLNAGQYDMPTGKGYNYRHNPESMERFWDQVGRETMSLWKIESEMFESVALKDNRQHSWVKNDSIYGYSNLKPEEVFDTIACRRMIRFIPHFTI